MASITVAEILELCQGHIANLDAVQATVSDPLRRKVNAPHVLKGSTADHIGFFFSRDYEDEVPLANPGVLLTAEPFLKPLEHSGLPIWRNSVIVSCSDPYLAMAKILSCFEGFHDPKSNGIHPRAFVDAAASVDATVSVGACAVIEEGARVASGCRIGANTFVGRGAEIGAGSVIFPGVVIYPGVKIGRGCRVHAGVVLGGDGFGYAPVLDDSKQVIKHQKIVHHGGVVIGDEVEIGAGTCIDRGTLGDTTIGSGTKIDNLVQVGHNCQIGRGVILCGKVGLAGGAIVGEFATIGGGTGVGNRVRVGARAQVGGMSRINKDVADGARAMGEQQRDPSDHFRYLATLNKIVKERQRERQKT